jgi:RNA polymerase sigma factor (sigma-70 family)
MKTTSTEKQLSIEDLLKQYQRYLIKVASNLTTDDYIKEELIQEASISLVKAYQLYDESKGELHSYLISYIRGSMLNYLTTHSRTIKVPANIVHHINRTEGLSFNHTLSLDTKIGDEDSSTLGDLVGDQDEDNSLDDLAQAKLGLLRHYIPKLKEQWQTIIKLRYFEEMTLDEIAEQLNITRQAVALQHDSAIKKLQELFNVSQTTNHIKFKRVKEQKRPNKK